jgi:hypothetical protein
VAASLPSTGTRRAYTSRRAKRPWIQASTSSSTAEDSEAEDSEAEDSEAEDSDANATDTRIASPDDEVAALAPTDAVAVACSLPSTGALRARIPRSAKKAWIQASTGSSTAEDSEAEDSDAEDSDANATDTRIPRSAKKAWIQASTSFSTAEDSDAEDSDANATDTLIASPDDKVAAVALTDAVALAASLPSTRALRARIPRSAKKAWIQASTSFSTAEDSDAQSISTAEDSDADLDAQTIDTVTTTSHDDTGTVFVAPTYAVTVPVSLPSARTSRASLPSARTSRPSLPSFRTSLASLPNVRTSRAPPRAPRIRWKPEEDAKLIAAVKKHGNNWGRVAAMVQVPGRTREKCRNRWIDAVDPTILTGKWTAEEDKKLTAGLKKFGADWIAVATMVPGRTNAKCHQRWTQFLDPEIIPGEWSPQEDTMLTKAVTKFGNDWGRVAAMLPGRPPHHCRMRWNKYVDPSIERKVGMWKPEEDAKLIAAVKEHGHSDDNWLAVAALVPGRTNGQVRYRWLHITWKPEEDATLTDAVKEHGDKNWVAVAALIPGRTHGQARERWLQKTNSVVDAPADAMAAVATSLPRTRASHASKLPRNWSTKEKEKLTGAVKKLGNNDWVQVATLVPGRTDVQCREKWALRDGNTTHKENRGKWTAKEDAKLAKVAMEFGKDWVQVAKRFPGRTNKHCRYRWVWSVDPAIDTTAGNSAKWTPEEDTALTNTIAELGKDWNVVAARVPGRTNGQCRYRWGVIHPDPDRGKWTPEEDAKLIEAVTKIGTHWVQVAAMVPGRSKAVCRQRWYYLGRIEDKHWKPEEDAKLTAAVTKIGQNWNAVAALVPDRTNKQCRERWVDSLDPDINTGRWTAEEDATLTAMAKKYHYKWVRVSVELPGRSNRQCRARWVESLDPAINAGKWTEE